MARFYLDEDIPPEVSEILAHYNHDVVHAMATGNQSIPDPVHLLIAARAGRILVTFNRRDFRQAHQFWTALHSWGNLDQPHTGILTSMGQISNNEWADLLHAFVSQGRNLNNQMWEWRRQQQRWFRFGW